MFPIFLGFCSPHVAKPEVTCEWVRISIIMESCTIYSLPGRPMILIHLAFFLSNDVFVFIKWFPKDFPSSEFQNVQNVFFSLLRHSQVLRFWHSEILCQCQRSIHQGPSQASRCHGHGMAEVWNMEGSCPSTKESNFPTKYIKYIKYIVTKFVTYCYIYILV
jgi:hypothetical protein